MSSNGFIVTLWLTAERFIAAFSRSGTSFHLENHIAWFYDGYAADRSLRQRLQGSRCPRGKKMPAQWRAFFQLSDDAKLIWQ
jgi:hypothetical protein